MECNSFDSYKKNSNPYAKKVCCPNMKREAKKWAKLNHRGKVWCLKTCCNACLATISKQVKLKEGKFRIKGTKLQRMNHSTKQYQDVFHLQTPAQVKRQDPDAQFRN